MNSNALVIPDFYNISNRTGEPIVGEGKSQVRTYGLFAGDIRDAFRSAAGVSKDVHIRSIGRKYKRVVGLLDPHYDEMWVGGKASYKLGAIIEDEGELIIFAPELKRISETHGALIEKYGYAPLEIVRHGLDLPLLKLNRNMIAGSPGKRHNRPGRILARSVDVAAAVHHEKIWHVV